ncbi:restriction endonuclease subunit S [uncultured Bifidobacterium sp.]|uniref:restriction endonuclease subunit S n=1 Tax=uncultured Bifidobacterium sp. TaxID=165187 RepID=UPI002582A66C|nr:restriction endonuclease subunit S [uncultured Bifidobacterium sp.]
MNESQNTPELRFEGFTEPWEQRKVSDIATLRRGLTYSPSDVVSPGQGVRVLRSSNVDEDRFVLRNDDVFVKEEAVNIPFSRDGEVLITAANGSTRLVGKRAKISGLMGKTVHGGFMLIAATEQPDFLCALMGTEWYRNFLHIGVSGGNGAIGNLDSHALECEKIRIPSSDEQHLVGGFFRDLDSLIDLQQRKYERLQHLKQALLRKMFPKPGEQVPELRFEGFTEPWKERKFKDVVTIERGGSPRPIEDFVTDSPNGLNWVKIGDAPSLGRYITRTAEKIRPEGLSKTRQVYPGDLILSNSMSFGRPYIMAIEGCIHDGWLLIRDTTKQLDPIYLCQMLGTPQMFNQYQSLAAGSTVNNLNKELVGNAVVPIPCKEEQKVIGKVLDDLDNLVILHQHKYERLQHLKQALLRKMFV